MRELWCSVVVREIREDAAACTRLPVAREAVVFRAEPGVDDCNVRGVEFGGAGVRRDTDELPRRVVDVEVLVAQEEEREGRGEDWPTRF